MRNGEFILMNILKNMNNLSFSKILNKDQLTLINRNNLNYPLTIAEKDYFLAIVSKIIFNSSIKEKLIFKGGTALHHVYLQQLRFSEDLDFSSNKDIIKLDEIEKIFSNFNFFEIKKHYISPATIKIERLKYIGPLKQANSLKIEIDNMQNVVLDPLEINYNNEYGIKTKVRVMDIREILAEKIRAMNERARYRDFYDFTMIVKKISININKIIELVREKEIRKDINTNNILNNWRIAQTEKQGDLLSIFYSEDLADNEITKNLKKLNFKEIKSNN